MLDLERGSIKNIDILNPEMPPAFVFGKFSRIDLVLDIDGELVNVEIQIKNENNYSERSLFHWAKLFTSKLKKGQDYTKLKRTITMNILGFNLFDCPEYHSAFTVMENTRHEPLSDMLSIHFFELKKIGKELDKNNSKKLWLQLINAETEEELDMLAKTEAPEIKKAVVILRNMSDDDRIREMARVREKAIWDETSALNSARREGEAKGRAEGEAKGRAEGEAKGRAEGEAKGRAEGEAKIIAKMRAAGMSDSDIEKILSAKV
jgi:predicted transposase/invertase (TIGR01784 family)